jgi:hypothetical protein
VGLAGGAGSACYVEEGPPEYVEGYEPPFYDGYVVYYDEVGRPYYYENGAVVWIAPGSPAYARFAYHWRLYGPGYRRWYATTVTATGRTAPTGGDGPADASPSEPPS